jgi:hypothetical protein
VQNGAFSECKQSVGDPKGALASWAPVDGPDRQQFILDYLIISTGQVGLHSDVTDIRRPSIRSIGRNILQGFSSLPAPSAILSSPAAATRTIGKRNDKNAKAGADPLATAEFTTIGSKRSPKTRNSTLSVSQTRNGAQRLPRRASPTPPKYPSRPPRRIGEKCIEESRPEDDRVVDVDEKHVKKQRSQVLRERRWQLSPDLLLTRKELLDNPEVADGVV